MTDYVMCGWRVASELMLPELPPAPGGAAVPVADLTIRIGAVPPIPDPVHQTPLLQIAADGTCRFEITAAAAYRVDPAGREIVIEPHMAVDAADIRVFLFSTVFAILCFRRGLTPLHASVVRIGDRAVAFSGISGAGKSTLAACFHQRGYSVLSDDVAVIDWVDGNPVVRPVVSRLKLWRDMMDRLGIAPGDKERARSQLEKYHIPLDDFSTTPLPLAAIYHLAEVHDPRHEGVRSLTGVEAFLSLERAVYRRALGCRLLGRAQLFQQAGKIAGAVTSARLARLKTLPRAAEIVTEITRRELAS
ncbi:MAG: hypothetical protein WCD42_00560 [Rhizomicrobium sp.]